MKNGKSEKRRRLVIFEAFVGGEAMGKYATRNEAKGAIEQRLGHALNEASACYRPYGDLLLVCFYDERGKKHAEITESHVELT